jgi:MFS transporter, ACS family, hexuronate transporter
VDVDAPLDVSKPHRTLLTSGAIIAAIGVGALGLIAANWELCVKAAKLSGAVSAVTAAGGVVVISLALLYAGLPKSKPAA